MSETGAKRGPSKVRSLQVWKRVLFTITPTIILFGGLELALRWLDFEYHGIPRHLQFGPNLTADIERNIATPDENLLWRFHLGEKTTPWLIERRHVNPALREITGANRRRTSVVRIVAMGDSCTFFGEPSYPMRLEHILAGRGLAAEVFNASIPGFSSFQGRRWFETEIAAYRPDWVALYFGWNDHWLAQRLSDADLAHRKSSLSVFAERTAAHLRLVQAGRSLWARFSMTPPGQRPFRVPPTAYHDNLNALCSAAQDIGSRVLMITAPSDLDDDDLHRLRSGGYIGEDSDVRGLHERYNEIVRAVAESCGATLVDFATMTASEQGFIMDDGIHLEQKGINHLATQLAGEIMAN